MSQRYEGISFAPDIQLIMNVLYELMTGRITDSQDCSEYNHGFADALKTFDRLIGMPLRSDEEWIAYLTQKQEESARHLSESDLRSAIRR